MDAPRHAGDSPGVQAAVATAQSWFAVAVVWETDVGSGRHSVPGQLYVLPFSVTLSKLHILPKLPRTSRSNMEQSQPQSIALRAT